MKFFKRIRIHITCLKYNIKNYTINDDMSIDVNGDVLFSYKKLSKIPLNFNIVNGFFSCSKNKLMSLKGCPKYIKYGFYCHDNKLTSLEHFPINVGGEIDISVNHINSFKGICENVYERLICDITMIYEVYKLFNKNPKCVYWLNEFDVIQGNNIILDRLEEVFHQLEMDVPKIEKIKYYNII